MASEELPFHLEDFSVSCLDLSTAYRALRILKSQILPYEQFARNFRIKETFLLMISRSYGQIFQIQPKIRKE